MANAFPNPELLWHAEHELAEADYDEVLKRVSDFKGTVAPLSGGLANHSFLLNDDRVLRIYRRDKRTLVRERQLLTREWQHCRVPQIYDGGDDYLLLEFVPHGPLQNSIEHGSAAGSALAEIHSFRFDAHGEFGDSLQVEQPWEDFPTAIVDYIQSSELKTAVDQELVRRLVHFVSDRTHLLRKSCQQAVLLHGDFKPSNLHWTCDDRLLVLDWEFTYAGPSLMDIGQLFRFDFPEPFRTTFVDSYQNGDGSLPADWESRCRIFDLVNLVGLLAKSEPMSHRADDCRRRIELTLRNSRPT